MPSTRQAQLTIGFVSFTAEEGAAAYKSHHDAGREAMRLVLEKTGISGTVRPHPEHGYVELTQSNDKPIPGIFINISHTDSLAVAAISGAPVGVDVEAITRDPSRALERLMSDRDRELLKKFPQPQDPRLSPALLLWTAKEAFSKALGMGMQAGMSKLKIDFEGPPPYRARTEVVGHLPLHNPLIHWEIRGDFLISVCTEAAVLRAGIERVSG